MTQADVEMRVPSRFMRRAASIRIIRCLCLLTLSASLVAQEQSEKLSTGLEITPLVSYWGGMHLPIQPNFQEGNPGIALDASPGYGFALGLRIQDENAIEVRWNRGSSYARISGVNVNSPKVPVTLNQLYCNFSHEFAFERRLHLLRPFLLASVGATKIEDSTGSDSIGFSAGIGAGVKLLLSRHVGFRMQLEWLPSFWGQQGSVSCGPGCAARIGGGLASQTEVAVGPIIRF